MTSTATCFTWRDIRKWSLTTVSYNGTGVRQVHVCSTSIAFPISVLQAKLFFFAVTKNRIGHGPRCRHSRSRRAIHRCSNDGAASILKSGPEIKNRCTQHGVNGENPASTLVRQWRLKRVLMRPEAAFTYVFAAEGAQHPPNKPPRSTTHRNEPAATKGQGPRFGKEEENLHFCRRKCKIKKERPTSPST